MKASGNRHDVCPSQLVALIYGPARRPPLPAARAPRADYRRHGGFLELKPVTVSLQRLVETSGLLLVGVATCARAQGLETVTAVPFPFTAGATTLPRVSFTHRPGARTERCVHDPRRASSRDHHDSDRSPERSEPAPSLTFKRYGNQSFLREVQLGDGRILHIPQTRAEIRAAEHVQPRPHRNRK